MPLKVQIKCNGIECRNRFCSISHSKVVFEQVLYERYVLECGREFCETEKILSESRVINVYWKRKREV